MKVGILGGGQLGRMLALAGYPLGFSFRIFDPAADACAGQVVADHVIAEFDDEAALVRFATGLDVITYEWENVPVGAVRFLERLAPVYPPVEALETAQDRLLEKTLFRKLGIATAAFASVGSTADVRRAVTDIGLPSVLKTRRGGYDGKGQAVLHSPSEADAAWAEMCAAPLILEGFVPFGRELSVIGVRGLDGRVALYPLVENKHREGILRVSRAPAPDVGEALQSQAHDIITAVLETTGYVGILAIELFEDDGRLLANEMAPRVHNSGHWTIEGAETSQFENHLRAICGLTLGSIETRGHSAMVNLIGAVPDSDAVLAIAGTHLHLYGKEPRAGRKLGHVTVRANDAPAIEISLTKLGRLIEN
ncbi:MAG TPA: 5-(carboxyamino)imidazole ribonucleotide synthase [Dehalococcoidia bacterium]